MTDSNPIFVKIDKYNEILDIVNVINKKINTIKQLLDEVESLKQKEDEEVSTWKDNLTEITHKIENVQEQLVQ